MEKYLENYDNFINQLKNIFINDENTINILNNNLLLNDDEKINRGKYFSSKINEYDFNSFYNNKIKIFSHKNKETLVISESIFGNELHIKNLLNNQPEEVSKIIWNYLHILWYYSEELKNDKNEEYINLMNKKLLLEETKLGFVKSDIRKSLEELLKIDLNEDTSNMIDEIINCFEELLNNPNSINEIFKISHKISNKYGNKIKNGNIQIDKILESIMSKIPGMGNMMNNFKDIKTLFQNKDNDKPILIDENFSTANVKVNEIEDKSDSIKIGSILKMADKLGIIPGENNKEDNSDNINIDSILKMADTLGIIPDEDNKGEESKELFNINKMMNIINNNNNIEEIHKNMSEFMEKELGLDINKMNEILENNEK
jgi:hypothetical protein